MKKSIMVIFVAALLLFPVAQVAFAYALTVQTDQAFYKVGSIVSISGAAAAGAVVDITIHYSSIQVYGGEVNADSTGVYGSSYTLPTDASLGVYTVTATADSQTSKVSFTVTSDSVGEIARQLIESAERSQALAGGTMRDIIALGYTVPQAANTEMNQGEDAIKEAKSLQAQGLFPASAEAAQRAMNHFRNALQLSLGENNGYQYTQSQEEILTHRLERLYDEYSRISELVANLAEDDVNLPALTTLMKSAETSLGQASTDIEEGNLDEANLAITAAQEDLQEAQQLIRGNLNNYRRGMMTQYANRLRERLNESTDDLEQLNGQIQASYMNAAMQRLGEANGLVTRAENRLQEGLDEDAVDDLEQASYRHRLGLGELGNDDVSGGVMQLDMIRSQIQAKLGVTEMLRRLGQDASQVEAQIQELRGLIENGLRMMKQGDYSGASKLFGDAAGSGKYYGSGQGGSGAGQGGSGGGKGSGGGN